MAAILPILLAALGGGAGFAMSGGIDKLDKQFNNNIFDDPSLKDWLTTGGSSLLGMAPFGPGATLAKFGIGGASKLAPRAMGMLARSPAARTGVGYLAGDLLGPNTIGRTLNRNPFDNPQPGEFFAPLMTAGMGRMIPNFPMKVPRMPNWLGRSTSVPPIRPPNSVADMPPEVQAEIAAIAQELGLSNAVTPPDAFIQKMLSIIGEDKKG